MNDDMEIKTTDYEKIQELVNEIIHKLINEIEYYFAQNNIHDRRNVFRVISLIKLELLIHFTFKLFSEDNTKIETMYSYFDFICSWSKKLLDREKTQDSNEHVEL
jgi:hypothetical protein